MILRETIAKVEKSKEFKSFKKSNPGFYLAHCFTMLDEGEKKYNWELGYYSDKKDKLVVFETVPAVKLRDEDDPFKREGIIKRLDMNEVKTSLARALEICDVLAKDKYSAHAITKRIIVLQNIDKPVYNITHVTRSYSILNVKIDAKTGEIISQNLQSIMQLGKWEKGEKERPAVNTEKQTESDAEDMDDDSSEDSEGVPDEVPDGEPDDGGRSITG
ncbi:MAG: PepSY domain-containing protein [archaeon]